MRRESHSGRFCLIVKVLTTMEECFAVAHILDEIIKRLGFTDKFSVQLVSKTWRSRAIAILRDQRSLVVSQFSRQEFSWSDSCVDHPLEAFVDNYVGHSYKNVKFWQHLMSLLPSLQVIFFDCRAIDFDETGQERQDMFSVISVIMSCQAKSLKCLYLPEYGDGELDNFVFPTLNLPQLQHLCFWETKAANMRNLFRCCPNIKVIKSSALQDFTDWSILPRGVKVLISCEGSFKGINSLLYSDASQTIETLNYFRLTPDLFTNKFWLQNLKEVSFSVKVGVNDCLLKLCQIIRCSPVLKRLELVLLNKDKIYPGNWCPVFKACSNITHLVIESPPRMCDSDFVVDLISQNMKQLTSVIFGFAISSQGLTMVSKLPHLEVYRQTIFDRDNLFDESALADFLFNCFGRKLSFFELSIAHTTFGKFMAFSDSFLDKNAKMVLTHNLSMVIESDQEEELIESREEGMTLLTNLRISRK